ncbi:centromere protein C [Gastrolobium bilobum]|uniref:centromere protein C n=1 Tax=Gastrolobium bilobum TaxID=150636 RepID=UPI002AB2666E|nr:centromere protein C [Gastrolobium bilobum]
MEKEGERCDGVVDPLADYWGLSLFPSKSGSGVPSSEPYNPDHDLDAIHNHLRSMALQSPSKLVEQAKSIVDGNPGLFNSEISSDPTFDESNDDVFAEDAEEFPRKRRPGLGLKRARFSLKPTRNPSIENLIPSLDIQNLKDPVEFFMAHERLENAKREIQKQMGGVSFEPNQDNLSAKPRQRRPGLLGNNQRPIRYRHRYPIETSDNNDHVPSSQEAFGSDSLDPVGENNDKGGACLTSLENEVTDSSTIEENKLNDILDGLLSCNSEDLEGDGALTILQERLQIKPIVVEKLSVPDFPDDQVIDLKSFRSNLSKPRKALSNIDNLLKGMNNKTPLRQDVGCPVQQLASPTPPRSPFASLSALQKHISRSKPSVDPFSAREIDHLSRRNYSPTNMINQDFNLVGSGKPSNELNAHIIEHVTAVSKTSSVLDTVRNCASTSENSKEDNSEKSSNKLNEALIEDMFAVSQTNSAEDIVRNCTSTYQMSTEDNPMEPGFGANIDSNEPHIDMDVEIGGSGKGKSIIDDMVGRSNMEANEPCQFEDKVPENVPASAASMPTDDRNFNLVNPLADQSSPAGFQANTMDKCTRRSDDGPEQYLQEKTDGTMAPVNGQRRVKSRSQRKSKDKRLPRRQSLAAAGTSWKSGLRRSTRIRTRPLEYWKGERLVYGRVHESLATVIGVKCMTPGSDGKPTMKVKSYVSDNYKELLELASLY